MADYSKITAQPDNAYTNRKFAEAIAAQNELLQKQVATNERIATALEAAVVHLKAIAHETGMPHWVFEAIKSTPEVLESYMITMNDRLQNIDCAIEHVAAATEAKKQ